MTDTLKDTSIHVGIPIIEIKIPNSDETLCVLYRFNDGKILVQSSGLDSQEPQEEDQHV